MTDLDLDAIAAKWLRHCALCDAGLPYGCTHPDEDYRPVILSLVREVERLRAETDEWTVELPPAAAEVLRAARAWREARRDMLFGLKPEASALVVAVDAAWPDGAA